MPKTTTPQQLDVTFHIHWLGPWHVGSGFGTPAVDRLIQRHGGPHGVPFVPGAQLKGVLRHRCEQLATALGAPVVSPHIADRQQQRQLVAHFRPLEDSPLVVDRLFGSRYTGQFLFVEEALPQAQSDEPHYSSQLAQRVAMDRVTGTAKEQRLFTGEVACQSEVPWFSRLRARHPRLLLTHLDSDQPPWEYALLLAGLLSIDAIGGEKSSGRGRCEIQLTDDSVQWNGNAVQLSKILQPFQEPDWFEWLKHAREE